MLSGIQRVYTGYPPESYFLEVEGVLDDASGGHPDPEDVLLGRQVAGLCHTVDVLQVTIREEKVVHGN